MAVRSPEIAAVFLFRELSIAILDIPFSVEIINPSRRNCAPVWSGTPHTEHDIFSETWHSVRRISSIKIGTPPIFRTHAAHGEDAELAEKHLLLNFHFLADVGNELEPRTSFSPQVGDKNHNEIRLTTYLNTWSFRNCHCIKKFYAKAGEEIS